MLLCVFPLLGDQPRALFSLAYQQKQNSCAESRARALNPRGAFTGARAKPSLSLALRMQSIVSTIHMKILCLFTRRQFRNNASRIKYSAALNNVDVRGARKFMDHAITAGIWAKVPAATWDEIESSFIECAAAAGCIGTRVRWLAGWATAICSGAENKTACFFCWLNAPR